MLVAIVTFIGVFVALSLVLFAAGMGAARTEQTKANLETALASNRVSAGHAGDVDFRKEEVFSNIPWLNRWLLKMEVAPRLRAVLRQADLNWTAGGLLLGMAACLIVPTYLVYLRTGQVLFGILCGVLCAYAPIGYVLHRRSKRFTAFEEGLPEALDLMVSGLRAGHSLVAALKLVAQESADPIGAEFRLCFEEQNYGLELRAALENMIARMPLQDLRITATALLVQKESGGNLAEVLEKTSNIIRERFKLKRQVRVHTAQGRLTGWILSLLPLVLGIALYILDPETMSILWTRKIGQELIMLSIVMTIIGGLIIRKIVNMEV
jgi:tight adherence protein B